jgi:hypothetical protein
VSAEVNAVSRTPRRAVVAVTALSPNAANLRCPSPLEATMRLPIALLTRTLLATCLATVSLAAAAHDKKERDDDDRRGRQSITVKIIGLNDFHGNLQSPGSFGENLSIPAAQRPAVGGAEYVGAYVARLKAANPNHVVVGAGDFIGASPLISALFFDEPTVEVMNRIGLDFNAVGNHEFDKGSAELLRLQRGGCKLTNGAPDPNSCQGAMVGTPTPFEGARFKWLSANVVATATDKTLLPAVGIKTFRGVRVAFIGMTLKATPAGVTMATRPTRSTPWCPSCAATASRRSSCWCTRAAFRRTACRTSTAATATSPGRTWPRSPHVCMMRWTW